MKPHFLASPLSPLFGGNRRGALSSFRLTVSALHAIFPLCAASPPRTAAGAPLSVSLRLGAYAAESCSLTQRWLELGGTQDSQPGLV